MADIFISYSRKDSPATIAFVERLRADGMDVWMDQTALSGAEKWSSEIVDAIEACTVLVLLISGASNESVNVAREVSLASEENKHILPVEVETVELGRNLKYPLAGLHRLPLSNYDAILNSIKKLGVPPKGSVSPAATVAVKEGIPAKVDNRKSLIVLPFEDLSPGQDNSWFSDGLTNELIDVLGHIKSLRLIDRKTTMDLKGFRGKTALIANELGVRYFIEGSVRKFGEQIKISTSLLDIEEGDYLWQESFKGEFKDIFEIQEMVAQKVVEGLNLSLSKEERSRLETRGTENAEAYELLLKANEYFSRQTREGFQHAIQLYTTAIAIDPNYATAYQSMGTALVDLYRSYDKNPAFLIEAEQLVKKALELKPDLWRAYHPLSMIYTHQGKLKEAEEASMTIVRTLPNYFGGYYSLGMVYTQSGQPAKAAEAYEHAVKLQPNELIYLWNLVIMCQDAGLDEKCKYWAGIAVPQFEKHLALHPDDEGKRVWYLILLHLSGKSDEARIAAKQVSNIRDGNSLYNISCLLADLGEYHSAALTFRKSVDAGFRQVKLFKSFLKNQLEPINGSREYEDVKLLIEQVERGEV